MYDHVISSLNLLKHNFWTPENLFNSVFAFSWVVFFWDMYVLWRQYRVYVNSTSMPVELSGIMDRETFMKARLYSIDRTKYVLCHNLWSQISSSIILLYFLMPKLWNLCGRILLGYGYDSSYEILRTLLFMNIGMLISKVIELPWSIYYNFVIQERHGLNRQTASFYAKDKVKKLILEVVLSTPIVSGVIYIIKAGGDYFFVYLWLFCSSVAFFMMTIYPNVIAPLFDKYIQLPEGPLRDKIKELAEGLKFPLTKILIVEGSKRSAHSNAYVFGLFNNKRIVLFDTLLESPPKISDDKKDEATADGDKIADDASKSEPLKDDIIDGEKEMEKEPEKKKKKGCTDDEVLAVLAHELGHWKLNHTLINLIISEIQMFVTFLIFGLLYKNSVIYQAFGFSDQPVLIGLIVITQFIFSPYHEVFGFLMTCLTRHYEFSADNFGKKLNKASDLRSALVKLVNDNLEFPIYDWLYSAINNSHPPVLERLKALGKID